MITKKLYKYRTEKGVIVSPNPPINNEYTMMYRLIAEDDHHLITDGEILVSSIDVISVKSWYEVHKDDLNTPVIQKKRLDEDISALKTIEDEQDSIIIELATELAILNLTM